MKDRRPLRYIDRATGEERQERIWGESALRWLYGTRLGRLLEAGLLSRRVVSRIFGWRESRASSRRRIPAFVERFGIAMDEFEDVEYASFGEFFIRRFRPGARSFATETDALPAFSEGRYLVFDSVVPEQTVPVKGRWLSAETILGDADAAAPFRGGPLAIARLCPTDYHRYHYPLDGETESSWTVHGALHSVHPFALAARGDIFPTNERRVSILATERFGRLAYVEVGALNVGRIVQTHPEDRPFVRGAEKGYFLLGGSTVLLFGEPGRIAFDDDLRDASARGLETFVRLGERIGRAAHVAG